MNRILTLLAFATGKSRDPGRVDRTRSQGSQRETSLRYFANLLCVLRVEVDALITSQVKS